MNKEEIKNKIKELEAMQSNTNSELFKLRSELYELELPDKLKEYEKFNDKFVMFNNDVIYYIKEVLDYDSGRLYFKGACVLDIYSRLIRLYQTTDEHNFEQEELIVDYKLLEYDEIKTMILDFIEKPIKACKEHE